SISLRTLKSSPRKSPNADLGAYQRLFQSSVMPVRKPVGLTFWPMLLRSFVETDNQMARPLHDVVRLTAILRLETLDRRTRIGPGLGDIQRVAHGCRALLVGVGDRGANDLLDHDGGALLREA